MSEELSIDGLAPQGDGVHRSERGPIYVERALPGDVVEAKVSRGAGGVLRGNVVRLLTASPHRVKPPCPHYDVCGGCSIQHADEAFYRNWKSEIVRNALARENLQPEIWREPIFLPPASRRRVTFAAVKNKNTVTLGFFRRRSHQVADVPRCLIMEPAIVNLRAGLAPMFIPVLRDGKIADLFIQVIGGACDLVITGPVGVKGPHDLQVLEAIAALANDLNIARISWRAREHDEPEVMIERNPVHARFGVLDVALPSLAFLQPTQAGEMALAGAVMDLLPKAGTFADLFSGCGTFTGRMVERGAVDAYDGSPSAIRALEKSKGTRPLRAIHRDLFRDPLQPEELGRYDAVVFDPPRLGAHEQAKTLAASDVSTVIAVSCNPATFARDARLLVDGGYRLASVQVVDQFVWSHHVELVAAFMRQS